MPKPLDYRRAQRLEREKRDDWPWHSRLVLLIAMILVPILGVLVYVGPAWPNVALRLVKTHGQGPLFIDGGLGVMWLAGAVGIGLFILRLAKLWDRKTPIALRWTTAAALGFGFLSLGTLGLGLLGALNSFTAWAMLVIGWALGGISLRQMLKEPGLSPRSWLKAPAGWAWLFLLATPFLTLALVAAMAPPGMLWTPEEPHGYDVIEYHLQVPREWYELHRIVPLHHNVFSFFPFNVEMHFLLAMHLRGGPWAGMYLAQLMHLTFVMLTVVAVYGLARKIAPPAGATIAALSLLTVPWLTQLAGIAYDEGGFLLFGVLAIGWAMIAIFDPTMRRMKTFALAGVFAGLACGSKLTAVPEVLLAVPFVGMLAGFAGLLGSHSWHGFPTRAERLGSSAHPHHGLETRATKKEKANHSQPGDQARDTGFQPVPDVVDREKSTVSEVLAPQSRVGNPCHELNLELRADPTRVWGGMLLYGLVGLLVFSPWLIRNYAWSRNPVFPEMMPLLGRGDFTPTQVERFELAHKAPPAQQSVAARLATFGREVIGVSFEPQAWRGGYFSSAAWQFGYLILPMGIVAFAFFAGRPESWFLFGLLLILTVFWLTMTHLQSRFFILAAPISALLIARIDWRRGAFAGVGLVVIFMVIGWLGINQKLSAKLYGSGANGVGIVSVLGVDGAWLYEQMMPTEIPKTGTVVLIGDARAFLYPIPMSRLRYRTVFDVDGDGSDDIVKAWEGNARPAAGDWLLIDPAELRRFHKTYFGLPQLPPEVERATGPGDQIFMTPANK